MSDALPTKVLATMLLAGEVRPGRGAAADRECLEEASWYARSVGASLHLLHVLDESTFPAEITRDDVERARASASARLAELAESTKADGIETSYEVRSGFPWIEVIREARDWGADLIVAGSRRRASRFFTNVLFGSTARRLLRKSEIPVWIARDTGTPPITSIAVAVDLTLPMSARLLAVGEALRATFGTRAHVIHSLPYELGYYSLEAAAPEPLPPGGRDAEIAGAREEIVSILGDSAANWHIHVGEGPVVADLGRLVEREGIDLVIMGSVSRTGIPGLVIGNTAETVFARVDCPLWVTKPAEWVSPVPSEVTR